MCPKTFSWAKNKRKIFSDGKSRGPLLAGAALKAQFIYLWAWQRQDSPLTGSP